MSIPKSILKTARDNRVKGDIAICRFALNYSEEPTDWTEEIHVILQESTAEMMSLKDHDYIANSPPRYRGGHGVYATIRADSFEQIR